MRKSSPMICTAPPWLCNSSPACSSAADLPLPGCPPKMTATGRAEGFMPVNRAGLIRTSKIRWFSASLSRYEAGSSAAYFAASGAGRAFHARTKAPYSLRTRAIPAWSVTRRAVRSWCSVKSRDSRALMTVVSGSALRSSSAIWRVQIDMTALIASRAASNAIASSCVQSGSGSAAKRCSILSMRRL